MGMQILIKAGRRKGGGKINCVLRQGLKVVHARRARDTTNLHVHYARKTACSNCWYQFCLKELIIIRR